MLQVYLLIFCPHQLYEMKAIATDDLAVCRSVHQSHRCDVLFSTQTNCNRQKSSSAMATGEGSMLSLQSYFDFKLLSVLCKLMKQLSLDTYHISTYPLLGPTASIHCRQHTPFNSNPIYTHNITI